MTIYTRTGDQGKTDLLGGVRVPKNTATLEVCGALDELNALLGLARCESLPDGVDDLLEQIQHQLFDVGTEVVAGVSGQPGPTPIGSRDVMAIEQNIDRYEAGLALAGTFILTAGSRAAAELHLARTVCRRMERRLVSLTESQPQAVSPSMLCYVNRLSDLFYILARVANAQAGIGETPC